MKAMYVLLQGVMLLLALVIAWYVLQAGLMMLQGLAPVF
jgi:hypothetical protein